MLKIELPTSLLQSGFEGTCMLISSFNTVSFCFYSIFILCHHNKMNMCFILVSIKEIIVFNVINICLWQDIIETRDCMYLKSQNSKM